MGIHRLTKWVLALAALFALSGCAGSPAAGDASSQPPPAVSAAGPAEDASPKLPFTLPYYPDYSIHPALAENRANLTLAPLLYEGLFSVDSRFQATPQLCESYFTSEDGLSWTFTLRPGVTFSDGTPLTGKLAAQALNTALGEGSRFAGRIPGLRSITGSDQTVTVNLSQPNGSLPTLLDILWPRTAEAALQAPGRTY